MQHVADFHCDCEKTGELAVEMLHANRLLMEKYNAFRYSVNVAHRTRPYSEFLYPAWQIPYEAARAEDAPQKQRQKIIDAETAVVKRLQELVGTPDNSDELVALRTAITGLRDLFAEKLHYPRPDLSKDS